MSAQQTLQKCLSRAEPRENEQLKVFVSAGEASSDEHTAGLIAHLFSLRPNLQVFGMGGSKLREVGMDTIVDSESSASVMGLTELFGSLGKIVGAYRKLRDAAIRERPDVAILVDFPDFNLRLAADLQKNGIKVMYFISPQLWAWRPGRVQTVRKYIDKMVVIFPFEEAFYLSRGVSAEFIGHPFLDRPPVNLNHSEFIRSIGLDPERPLVALLPGSRRPEVERLLEPMVEAFMKVRQARPGLQAVLPVAPTLSVDWIRSQIPEDAPITLLEGQARELLHVATVAMVASGTATVEAALSRVPFFVVYRLSGVTFRVARLLVKGVQNIAMVNLIAGEPLVEELVQEEANPERMAAELERLLGDPLGRERLSERLGTVEKRLQVRNAGGLSSATERAAHLVLELV